MDLSHARLNIIAAADAAFIKGDKKEQKRREARLDRLRAAETLDLHMAVAGTGFLTHLTEDAELTLCGRTVLDLPKAASVYCEDCIDSELLLLLLAVWRL